MYSQKTLKDSPSATSSRESEDGQQQLDLLAGMMSDPCGQEAHPASHSVQPGTEKDKTMSDTCGLSSSISSASARLQSSLESRLRQPLERAGSTIYKMTWKQKATPAQWPYCQLAASVPRTKEIDSSMSQSAWPTPSATCRETSLETMKKRKEFRKRNANQNTVPMYLTDAVQVMHSKEYAQAMGYKDEERAAWPTPTAHNAKENGYPGELDKKHTSAGSGSASNSGLADAHGSRQREQREFRRSSYKAEDEDREVNRVVEADTLSNFWAGSEYIYCRDGKERQIPTEPALFPLAHGLPNRVGTLRGAGNAIVPQVAAEIIKAYMG